MPTIHLTHFIPAPVEVLFDLARHVGVHKESMSRYKEDAVAGTRFGLLENEETVTWKGKHLYRERFIRMKVTAMKKPEMYVVEQLQGNFRSLRHEYHFKSCENGSLMINLFNYELKLGLIGTILDRLFLRRYFRNLLEERYKTINQYVISGRWKPLLNK